MAVLQPFSQIPTQARNVTFGDVLIAYIIGLFWANAAVLWRTMMR
jgi:hypothetical protein